MCVYVCCAVCVCVRVCVCVLLLDEDWSRVFASRALAVASTAMYLTTYSLIILLVSMDHFHHSIDVTLV